MTTPHHPSTNQIHTRARFGLPLHDQANRDRFETLLARARHSAHELHSALGPGQIALITGPSGSGKSLVVEQLISICPRPITPLPHFNTEDQAPVDLLQGPLEVACQRLASCGLADANQLVTPARHLSLGEQARLALALTLDVAHRIDKPCTIIIDEFASSLDRTTAACLGACIRKQIRAPLRLVAASAHDDLIEALAPDRLLYTPLESTPELLSWENSRR